MPSIFNKKNGSWAEIKSVFLKKNNVWIEILSVLMKKNNVWIDVYSGIKIPGVKTYPAIHDSGGLVPNATTNPAYVGDTFTGINGTWSNTPTSYQYRWQWSNYSGGPYQAFSPAQTTTTLNTNVKSGSTFTFDNRYVIFEVKATNSVGSSEWVASPEMHLTKIQPQIQTGPDFDGVRTPGQNITVTSTWQTTFNVTGDWAPDSYFYSWTYADTNQAAYNDNNSNVYLLSNNDVGHQLKVTITATNSGGSTSESVQTDTIYGKPYVTVSPTLTKVNGYQTVTNTLSGNTGTYNIVPDTVYWGFQWASSATASNTSWKALQTRYYNPISGYIYTNYYGTDNTHNTDHSYSISSQVYDITTASDVSLIGKYVRFYSIGEKNGSQSDTYYTGAIGPIYGYPGAASNLYMYYSRAYSTSFVYAYARFDAGTNISSYSIQYNNGGTWTNLTGGTGITTVPGIGSEVEVLAPVGSNDYRVIAYNGDGVSAVSSTYTKAFSAEYAFSFGNILYPGTNGYVNLNSGSTGYSSAPTSGFSVVIFPYDLRQGLTTDTTGSGYLKYWSDADNFVIYEKSYALGYENNANGALDYQIKFNKNNAYADVKIIRKGANVGTWYYAPGLYYNGNLYKSGLAPNTGYSAGTYIRFYFDGSPAAFGNTFTEIPEAAMLSAGGVTSGTNDDGYTSITTSINQYVNPSVTFTSTTPTATGSSLTWTYSSSSGNYNGSSYVVRTGSHTGTQVTTGTTTATGNLSVTGLSSNTTYYIQLTPTNSLSQNGTVIYLTGTTNKTATAPTSLTASTNSSTATTLTWSGGSADYYEFYYGSTNTSFPSAADFGTDGSITASPYDHSAPRGYDYYYFVRSVVGTTTTNTKSGWYPSAAPGIKGHRLLYPPPVPNTPTTSGITTTNIDVSWTAGTNGTNNDTATSYEIYTNTTGTAPTSGTTGTAATSPKSFTYTASTSPTTQYFWVRAKNEGGTSGWSSSVSATPTALKPPNTPTSPTTSGATASQITFSWTAPGTDSTHNAATSYYYVSSSTNSAPTTNGSGTNTTSTSVNVGSLSASTTYYFWVQAYNADGYSAWTSQVNATTTAALNPQCSASGVRGYNSFSVTYTLDNTDCKSVVIVYGTSTSYGSSVGTYTSNGTATPVGPLLANTTYYWKVTPWSNTNGTGTSGTPVTGNTTTYVNPSHTASTPTTPAFQRYTSGTNSYIRYGWNNQSALTPTGDYSEWGYQFAVYSTSALTTQLSGSPFYQAYNTISDSRKINGNSYIYVFSGEGSGTPYGGDFTYTTSSVWGRYRPYYIPYGSTTKTYGNWSAAV